VAPEPIDLQPCGGTHVANTAEIGAVVVTKIEKKSATTRRIVLGFARQRQGQARERPGH
jgi:misacylated tRNA(Ala) deacylase